MSSLRKLRSDAMRGKWSEVLEMYKKESALRIEKITAKGDTLLHMAVSNRQVKVVEKMVDLLVQEEKSVVVTVDGDSGVSQNVKIVLGAENDEKNTPLHLAVTSGSLNMCKKISSTDPSLIAKRNIMGETPLLLAALYGRKKAFLWLHYLYVRNHGVSSTGFAHYIRDDGDTILHCAIGGGHIGVAIEIVHLYKDHLQEMMKRNKEGLSPLHLLASKPSVFASTTLPELPILLRLIYALWRVEEKNNATTFEELSQEAEYEGIFLSKFTAGLSLLLQAPLVLSIALLVLLLPILQLSISENVFPRWLHNIPKMKKNHKWCHQIMAELLQHASDEDMSQIISGNASEQLPMSLQAEEDNESESGTITIETPLMNAAYNSVVEIKRSDKWESRVARTSGTKKIETPLMIAVKNGVVEMVEKILELFPRTIKDVNADGKNILLLAVEYRQIQVLSFLCKQKWLTRSLFRQEDRDGNNALHLAAGLNPKEEVSLGNEINWFKDVKDSMPDDLFGRYNKKMEAPEDIFGESHRELKKREAEWVAKTSEACSLVSTLFASVAFSTRTNVPGGCDNGYAILRNKPRAFKTFRYSSFAALFFSLISTICFLSIVASRSHPSYSVRHAPSRFYCGVYFMLGSIVCLLISFCAGDFFMLCDDPQELHKVLPTYIGLTCGVILIVVLQLPKFIRPKLSRLLRIIPAP